MGTVALVGYTQLYENRCFVPRGYASSSLINKFTSLSELHYYTNDVNSGHNNPRPMNYKTGLI